MGILIFSLEFEDREDGKGWEQKWGALHFSCYCAKTEVDIVFPEIRHLLTVQTFIKIIQRGLTWRVKLLSDIYIWADRCTLQWLRALSTSLSLASPARYQSLSFHSTFCHNSPLAVFDGNEPSNKPHPSLTCSTASAAADSTLSTLTCTGLQESKKAPVTGPWARDRFSCLAWARVHCCRSGASSQGGHAESSIY